MNPDERRMLGDQRAAATGGAWEIARDGAAGEWCVVADHGPGVARELVAKCGNGEMGCRNALFAAAAGNSAQELLDMLTRAEARAADAEHERDEARARAGVAPMARQVERLREALGMYATGYRSPDVATQVLGEMAGAEVGA